MDRIDTVKAIARNLGDLILDSTVASAFGSAMRFDELIHPNPKQLQGKYSYIYKGAGSGQNRVIGSLNTTTRLIMFSQVFASTPSINSQAIITDYWDKLQFDNSVDRIVGKAKLLFLQDKVATINLVATQYEYAVPSGFQYISTLRLIPSQNTDYDAEDTIGAVFEIPPRFFRIEMNPNGSYIIAFDSRKINLDDFDDYWVRVEGQVKPDIGTADTSSIPEDLEEYIIAGASMMLSAQRINENQEWRQKFYMFRDTFRPLEDYIYRHGRGRKVG